MLITWDAGRPYEIDTKSLDVVTPIGSNTEWKEQIPLDLPFEIVNTAAHPVFDPHDQNLYTINYGKSIKNWLTRKGKSVNELINKSQLRSLTPQVLNEEKSVEELLEEKYELTIQALESAKAKLNPPDRNNNLTAKSASSEKLVTLPEDYQDLPEDYQNIVEKFVNDVEQSKQRRSGGDNFLNRIWDGLVTSIKFAKAFKRLLQQNDFVKLIRWD